MMIRNFDICNIVDCTMKVWEGLCRNAVSVTESIETMSPPRDDELQPRLGCKCYQPVWWGPGQRQVHSILPPLPPLQHFTGQTRRKVRKRDRFRL